MVASYVGPGSGSWLCRDICQRVNVERAIFQLNHDRHALSCGTVSSWRHSSHRSLMHFIPRLTMSARCPLLPERPLSSTMSRILTVTKTSWQRCSSTFVQHQHQIPIFPSATQCFKWNYGIDLQMDRLSPALGYHIGRPDQGQVSDFRWPRLCYHRTRVASVRTSWSGLSHLGPEPESHDMLRERKSPATAEIYFTAQVLDLKK